MRRRVNSTRAIPAAFVHDLLARVDIVEIVGRSVELKRAGSTWKGLCPFHGEKSPSFTVSPSRQTYHCFGCGVHGNAVGFLMEQHGMGFVEAVRDLAQQAGLTVPEDDSSPGAREEAVRQKQRQLTLTEVLSKAADGYRQQLKGNDRAIAYLKGRGLSGEIAPRSAWATWPIRGAAWRASSRATTIRCSRKADWSSPAPTKRRRRAATTPARASATTAFATGSCFRSARCRAR